MRLVRFRHKGLRQLHESGSAKGLPVSMADKLRKLLFALETAETLDQTRPVSGMEAAPPQRRHERIMEFVGDGKLAPDFPYSEETNTASDMDLIDYS